MARWLGPCWSNRARFSERSSRAHVMRRNVSSNSAGLLPVCLLLILPWISWATSPELGNILPTGGQRGTELEVSFLGDRLQDAEEILWYEPGIQVANLTAVTNQTVRARLKIAPDCPLGE